MIYNLSAEELKTIFSDNLNRLMVKHNKRVSDLSVDLGYSYMTVSDWARGKNMPRMDKIEILASYFNVSKADLIEEQKEKEDKVDFDSFTYALFEETKDLTDEKKEALLQMARLFNEDLKKEGK
jgi:Helix-turn-helix.